MRRRIVADIYAFVVAAVLFLFLCAVLKITPFGDNSFLIFDMKRQYVDFFSYFRSVVFTENDMKYSLSNGLGGEMPGFFAYYLTSPLNVIFFVVPHAYYPEAVTALLCIKTGFTAVTCREFLAWDAEYFMRGPTGTGTLTHLRRYSDEGLVKMGQCTCPFGPPATILMSVAYAFSAHFVMNLSNTIWHDAFLWAPVFLMVSLKLVGEKPANVPVPLAAFLKCALAAAVLIYLHYYIAYMVLIFTFVWVVVRAVRIYNPAKGQVVKRVGMWCLACVLGAALTALLTVPTALALPDSAKGEGSVWTRITESVALTGTKEYSVSELLKRFVPFTFTTEQVYEGAPQVYVGVVVCLMAGGYVVNCIRRRKSGSTGTGTDDPLHAVGHCTCPFDPLFLETIILLVFLLLCFLLPPLDLIMHGGSAPWGYRFRYAFLFSFVLVVMAHRFVVARIEKCDRGTGTAVTLFPKGDGCSPHDEKCDSVPVPLSHFSRPFVTIFIILSVLILADSLANAAVMIIRMSYNMETASHYREWTREMEKALADAGIKNGMFEGSDEVFRIEVTKDLRRSENDASAFAFNGVTHYNSEGNMEQYRFLQSLGMNYDGHFADFDYDNLPAAVAAITGVKYIIAPNEDGSTGVSIREAFDLSDQSIGSSDDPMFPFYLPVATTYRKGCFTPGKNAWEEMLNMDVTKDPYLYTSRILSALDYSMDAPGEETARLYYANPYISPFDDYHNRVFSYNELCISNVKAKNDRYIVTINPTKGALVNEMPVEGYFYLSGLKNLNQNMSIYLNDNFRSGYANASAMNILHMDASLPEYNGSDILQGRSDTIHEIRLEVSNESSDGADFGTPVLIEEDPWRTHTVFDRIVIRRQAPLHKITSSHLQIEVPQWLRAANKQFVVLLPYHRGWSATVDGRACEITRIFGDYMLIETKESDASSTDLYGYKRYFDRVDLTFTPPGMYAGWAVSVAAWVILVFIYGQSILSTDHRH